MSYVPARDHTFPVGRATKLLYAIPFVATLATCGNVWLAGKNKKLFIYFHSIIYYLKKIIHHLQTSKAFFALLYISTESSIGILLVSSAAPKPPTTIIVSFPPMLRTAHAGLDLEY